MNVHTLIATGVNADGHREIPDLEVTNSEDGAILAEQNDRSKASRCMGQEILASANSSLGQNN